MVLAARLLSEEGLESERASRENATDERCEVCDLQYKTRLANGKPVCAHCGLQGSVWCLDKRAEPSGGPAE
jgi:hypothetical protein